MSKSVPPHSLRNIPPDSLKLAYKLSEQMGLSLSDVFRLALTSGLLVEATKVAPGQDGTLAGWDGLVLAKALRRHLVSAIDLLIEYEEHPYGMSMNVNGERKLPSQKIQRELPTSPQGFEQDLPLGSALEDDLETLGIGFSLSEVLKDNNQ